METGQATTVAPEKQNPYQKLKSTIAELEARVSMETQARIKAEDELKRAGDISAEVAALKEALSVFAKFPCDPSKKPDEVIYRISRNMVNVDITNEQLIRAKKLLGMM